MTNTTTAPTAAQLDAMDIDTYLATIATTDITTPEQRAAWAAEDAKAEAIRATRVQINTMTARYWAALDMGDTATCRAMDEGLFPVRAKLAALLAN